jgi:hypothetical protein
MRQAILWSVALLIVLTSASCRQRSSAPKAATAPAETYQTRDGLQITPVEVEQNELAAVLGVKWWRFHIIPSSPDRSIRYGFELRKQGESPREIAGGSMWAAHVEQGQMVVALCPIEGEISTADRLKTYVRIAGASGSKIMENPLKGFSNTSISPTPTMQTDESFTLLECSRSGRVPDPNGAALVLTIRAGEPVNRPPQ